MTSSSLSSSSQSQYSLPSRTSPAPSQSKSVTEGATPHQSAKPATSRRTSKWVPHRGGADTVSSPSGRLGSGLEPEILPLALHPPLGLAHPHQQLHYQTFQDIPAPSVDGPSDEEDGFSEASDWSMVVRVLFGLAAGMIVIWLMVQMVLFAIEWSA
ncbi:hypothetical protein PG994_014818 [Apiospora phragmitis]|uniref:Uncharacterized protein n=1 Tax=Apiospora phragmitis TaxID=2905665 RepID=A0ABR1SUR6_9PEZI